MEKNKTIFENKTKKKEKKDEEEEAGKGNRHHLKQFTVANLDKCVGRLLFSVDFQTTK